MPITNIYVNMMLPKSNAFMLLRNNGPGMAEKDNQWSMTVYGDGNKLARIEDDATSANFRTSKPPC
jgi:hypothetical protein